MAVATLSPATSQAAVATTLPQYGTAGVRYATLGDRFIAQLIDWIIVGAVAALITIPFGAMSLLNPFTWTFYLSTQALLGALVPLLYFSYFESAAGGGQTLGKRVISIKVVDQQTLARIDLGRAFIRTILRVVDFLPFLYIVGALLIETSNRKQRLGDMAANSIVVKV